MRNNKHNVIIRYGATSWTAQVRDEDGHWVNFDLRKMPRNDPRAPIDQRRFRVELVKAFRIEGQRRRRAA